MGHRCNQHNLPLRAQMKVPRGSSAQRSSDSLDPDDSSSVKTARTAQDMLRSVSPRAQSSCDGLRFPSRITRRPDPTGPTLVPYRLA